MQSGMYIPIYTLLPYKEVVIDNFKMRQYETIGSRAVQLSVSVNLVNYNYPF